MPPRTLADTLSFPSDRQLLHPKFESYKLTFPKLSSPISNYPLATPFRTKSLPEKARVGFSEVQSRARYNHLGTGKNGEVIWINRDGIVHAAKIDHKTAEPKFFKVVQLPQISVDHPAADPTLAFEYPRAIALSSTQWIISDGYDSIYLVEIDPSSLVGTIKSTFTLSSSDSLAGRPLRLHRADILSNERQVRLFLSATIKGSPARTSQDPQDTDQPKLGTASSRLKLNSSTTFEYFTVTISLEGGRGETGGKEEMEPDWRMKGDDLPSFVEFDRSTERYIVATSTGLTLLETEPVPVEFPRTEEDREMTRLEGTDPNYLPPPPNSISTPNVPKPPPFSWTQDKSSLTVAFPIPSDTPISSIRITFSKLYLTLHIASPRSTLSSNSQSIDNPVTRATIPRISHKKWWAEIDPHTSVWTFDREAEGRDSSYGILTLHLEKRFEGTKWSDVFMTTSREEGQGKDQSRIVEMEPEEEYEQVAETIDPSELAKISEDFEKWTRGIMEGGGVSASQEGLGHGVPTSLMGDEMDVQVDGDTGRPIVVSWIDGKKGQEPKIVTPHPSIPYSLLSTSLPFASSSTDDDSTITLKHDVDGLLFTPPTSSTSPRPYEWTHTSTFPALAFVLATKRDTKFVYHHSNRFVLAFDSPNIIPSSTTTTVNAEDERSTIRDGAGNLFIYFAPQERKDPKGRQMVLRVGAGSNTGPLMGVAGVELEGGEVAVVALCERELIVIRFE